MIEEYKEKIKFQKEKYKKLKKQVKKKGKQVKKLRKQMLSKKGFKEIQKQEMELKKQLLSEGLSLEERQQYEEEINGISKNVDTRLWKKIICTEEDIVMKIYELQKNTNLSSNSLDELKQKSTKCVDLLNQLKDINSGRYIYLLRELGIKKGD